MPSNYLVQILLPLLGLLPLSLSNLDEGGTQFISYNGTIAGHFQHPASAPPECPTYYFDSLRNSFVTVGANPPWDTNPLYFDISHKGELLDSSRCYYCTGDAIFNLFFSTANYLCFNNAGELCDFDYNYHFVPQVIIDLNKATLVEYDWGHAGKGYSIAGDQSTFRGNGTPFNSFDFQRPENYTWHHGCADELKFQWNSTTPFTYAVNFTNTTAEALFSLAAPLGTVTFLFSGSRVDDNRLGWKPSDNGNYTPIALNTSDPSRPRFQFTNGSQFVWRNYSNGWSAIAFASAAALSIDESLALWWKWLWLLSMVVAGGLSLEGL